MICNVTKYLPGSNSLGQSRPLVTPIYQLFLGCLRPSLSAIDISNKKKEKTASRFLCSKSGTSLIKERLITIRANKN